MVTRCFTAKQQAGTLATPLQVYFVVVSHEGPPSDTENSALDACQTTLHEILELAFY